jgi:DNA integrity scanning protein DisA with diadenylate cyclase activity
MLYTFNCFDSASKTVFTDCVDMPEGLGPNGLATLLANYLHALSNLGHFYRAVAAWQVLEVTVVVIQTDDNRVLTVQLEP